MSEIDKYKLPVSKTILLFMAGAMWTAVGIMLLNMARTWLINESESLIYLGAGFGLALLIHHFGFLKIADKNLNRILSQNEKKSIFSFISKKSYLIIPVMIIMGYSLRHSEIPKPYLAVIYIGIGLALILSSIRYIRYMIKELRK